ncbi:MAG TPA: tetratricopeptide repeat protein, partial [Rhodothermales bacterium]|nr:tetratricopeptide repeat protein [Rhodothermales bacterium]
MERLEDALTLLDQGDTARAAEVLEHLVARTPAHATVHVLLAQAYERQHRWAEALAAWQTARLLLPDVALAQQGSLRAARVLAALRTMTAAEAPPRPPEPAPSPPAPAAEPEAAEETTVYYPEGS